MNLNRRMIGEWFQERLFSMNIVASYICNFPHWKNRVSRIEKEAILRKQILCVIQLISLIIVVGRNVTILNFTWKHMDWRNDFLVLTTVPVMVLQIWFLMQLFRIAMQLHFLLLKLDCFLLNVGHVVYSKLKRCCSRPLSSIGNSVFAYLWVLSTLRGVLYW